MDLALVIVIDLIAIITVAVLANSRDGLERALPFVAFLMALVPIESLLPLGFFSLTTHRILIGLLAVFYLARRKGMPSIPRASLPFKGLIAVHALWSLVATANSIVPEMSIKKLLSVLLEYYLLYFLMYKCITKVETIHRILLGIVLGLIVCCTWGSFEAYNGWDILDYFPSVGHHWGALTGAGEQDREVRAHSTYDHAILYGAALAMSITLTLYLLTIVRKKSQRVLLWVGLLLMFLNIYKTSSRGPWLDAMLGCLLLLLFGKGQVRRTVLYIAMLSVSVLIIRPGVWATIAGIYDNTFDGDTATASSYAYRFALQHAAVDRLKLYPSSHALWGYGPESFYNVHLEGMLLGKHHVFLSCDNAWVEFLIETGFIGLVIVILLLAQPMWTALRGSRRGPPAARELNFLLFVNFVMFYFQMYSVGMYSWGQNGYLLWILIAVTMAHARLHARRRTATPIALPELQVEPVYA
ncbi:MAG: O-antigen ligase family protein [Acidobacteriaceae bacterium]|nr:O-antigen ligase family protein [Acidobacteriaceae bacterium]